MQKFSRITQAALMFFSLWLPLLPFSAAHAEEILTIGATPVPHAEILEFIKPALAKQGVTLRIKVFTDYVQPNLQVAQKHLDANFFQHKPYLDEFNQSRGTTLSNVIGVHVEPFGAYSKKIRNIAELPVGATVAVPNDATNGGRALLLLAAHGLLRLKTQNLAATPHDITDNPKKLKFRELEAATLPRALGQVDLALINTNYALDAGLSPMTDALLLEDVRSLYVNILVARPDNANHPALKKLAAALTSPETRRFIQERYKGAVAPVF
ncbi:MAG: MetQ/NlpA family ABC transporter substrate-binding protein [Zoogloeaceae bacterium]|jgi:D-methionine transport system substrate-binding protein|nr:MetQ/NlpA family ABC transporter substrate-binding protein [Zoogloeaceae bacterium]